MEAESGPPPSPHGFHLCTAQPASSQEGVPAAPCPPAESPAGQVLGKKWPSQILTAAWASGRRRHVHTTGVPQLGSQGAEPWVSAEMPTGGGAVSTGPWSHGTGPPPSPPPSLSDPSSWWPAGSWGDFSCKKKNQHTDPKEGGRLQACHHLLLAPGIELRILLGHPARSMWSQFLFRFVSFFPFLFFLDFFFMPYPFCVPRKGAQSLHVHAFLSNLVHLMQLEWAPGGQYLVLLTPAGRCVVGRTAIGCIKELNPNELASH